MKIKIEGRSWEKVVLFDPPSRTVTLVDGSVWHLGKNRNEILELDIYITKIIGQHAPWELLDDKTLVLSEGQKSYPDYDIQLEEEDKSNFEFFYFYKFLFKEADYLDFPPNLLEGKCVRIRSAAIRYFLADTLFFDFLISANSSRESVSEVFQNMTGMKRHWRALKKENQNEREP